jgi:hypothetical protein
MIYAGGETEDTGIKEFYDLIENEMILSEQFVDNLKNDLLCTETMPSDIRRVELEMAMASLTVKKILIANYIGTPSIMEEKIQEKLLEILRKHWINQIDLIELIYLTKLNANA